MGFVPVIILIFGGIAYLAAQQHKRTVESWRTAARQLGLHVKVKSRMSRPAITGTLNGIPVTIDTYTQRSGNSSTTYTRYRAAYPSLNLGLTMKREGGLSFITKMLGFEDVEVGDPVFDGAFTIKTDSKDGLTKLLTPSVRSGLLRFMASYPNVVIGDSSIKITKAKFENKPEVLTSTIQRLVATAQLVKSPSAGVSDSMVINREQGLLDDVAETIRRAIETNPEDVDQRIFEVETLAAAGHEKEANTRLRELEEIAPADPDVAGWKSALSQPNGASSSTAEEIDVNELADDLFASDDLSFETRTKFNSQYAGQKVSWGGKVKQVTDRRGTTKATITVASVNNDLYGNTDIAVVVENPSGLTPTKDQKVTVSGTLNTIDPLMRNLFVVDATLS